MKKEVVLTIARNDPQTHENAKKLKSQTILKIPERTKTNDTNIRQEFQRTEIAFNHLT